MKVSDRFKAKHLTEWLRWLLFLVFLVGLSAFFYCGGYRYLDFAVLQAHSAQLQIYVTANLELSWLTYMSLFLLAALFCIPSLIFLMVVGGFLFGILPSFIAIVFAETVGAITVFFLVRTTLGSMLVKRLSPQMLSGLQQKNRVTLASYLLFLRMFPLVPFGAINVGAGMLNLPPRLFGLTTFFGVMPEAVLYSWVGTDLQQLLQQGPLDAWSLMLTPSIFWPLCIAALLALLPVVFVHIHRAWRKASASHPKN